MKEIRRAKARESRPPLRFESGDILDRALRLAGLGVRSRGAVIGTERVREAARSGRLALAIVATDASSNTLDKLAPLLTARGISFIQVPSADQLGASVGRERTAAVGITDRQLAHGIRALARSGSPRSA